MVIDAVSTVWGLEHANTAYEQNATKYFHKEFGLRRGQVLHFAVNCPILLIGVYIFSIYIGVTATALFVGIYLGIAIRQFITAYDVKQGFTENTGGEPN